MKKLLGIVVLFSSLSAMANSFYIDCHMGGEAMEGYRVTRSLELDVTVSQNAGPTCLSSVKGTFINKSCTYGFCQEDKQSFDGEKNCFTDIEQAKSEIIKKYCDSAESATTEDGERPVRKQEINSKIEEC